MSKKNKPLPPTRPSHEITQQYTSLCAELGNALLQFEMVKSKAIAQYQQLNAEMQRAQQLEAQKAKEEKGEKLVQMVANHVAGVPNEI